MGIFNLKLSSVFNLNSVLWKMYVYGICGWNMENNFFKQFKKIFLLVSTSLTHVFDIQCITFGVKKWLISLFLLM